MTPDTSPIEVGVLIAYVSLVALVDINTHRIPNALSATAAGAGVEPAALGQRCTGCARRTGRRRCRTGDFPALLRAARIRRGRRQSDGDGRHLPGCQVTLLAAAFTLVAGAIVGVIVLLLSSGATSVLYRLAGVAAAPILEPARSSQHGIFTRASLPLMAARLPSARWRRCSSPAPGTFASESNNNNVQRHADSSDPGAVLGACDCSAAAEHRGHRAVARVPQRACGEAPVRRRRAHDARSRAAHGAVRAAARGDSGLSAQGRSHRSARADQGRAGAALWPHRARSWQRARRADGERLRRSGTRAARTVRQCRRGQSVRACTVTRERMHAAFADMVLDPSMLDRLGPALNSGKAIFVYGAPGTGKTYTYAKARAPVRRHVPDPARDRVGDTVIRVYDASVHRMLEEGAPSVMLNRGHDPRYVLCRRPVVITGGELRRAHAGSAVRPRDAPVPRAAPAQGEWRHLHSRRPRPPARAAGDRAQSLDRADGRRRRLSQPQHRTALPHALRCRPRVLDQSAAGRSRRRRVPAAHRLQDRLPAARRLPSITRSGSASAKTAMSPTTQRSANS